MSLNDLLSEKRSKIIKKWRDAIMLSYPKDSQSFLRREKSQFANPIGSLIGKEIEKLYDGIIEKGDPEKMSASLEAIIRIRAVQDFTPSQAVAFVIQLKQIIREELGVGSSADLQGLEDRIDEVLLLAFDIYSKCRQKLNDIRVREVKNQVGRLLEKANLIVEIPEQSPGL